VIVMVVVSGEQASFHGRFEKKEEVGSL